VEETAAVLTRMNAQVTLKRYPGKPHSVSADEIELAHQLVTQVYSALGPRSSR
jgi:hypothetical protein